jgi:hypothetical protein
MAFAATAPNASARSAARSVRLVRAKVNVTLVDDTRPASKPVTRYPWIGPTTWRATKPPKLNPEKNRTSAKSRAAESRQVDRTVPPGATAGRRGP